MNDDPDTRDDSVSPESPHRKEPPLDGIGGFFLGCGGGGVLLLVALILARVSAWFLAAFLVIGTVSAALCFRSRRTHTGAGLVAAMVTVLLLYGSCIYVRAVRF